MGCFHSLPVPEQILIAVWVNTGNKELAVKSAGYTSKLDAEMFIKSKLYRDDFKSAHKAVLANPALIHEPATLDIQVLKKMAIRAFEAEIGAEEQSSAQIIRLLWDILRAEQQNQR